MADVIPEKTARFVRAMAPPADETVAAMEEYGESHGPATVGREAGGLFRFLARIVGAERVFEFGSGYGYSGYWFALGVGEGGEVVLTDVDASNLQRAREFFRQGGIEDRLTTAVGDAHDAIDRQDGQFDVVLIDHDKARYAEAFAAARDRLAPGGLVVADNAMVSTSIDFDALLSTVEAEEADLSGLNDATRGVAQYLRTVRAAPEFETTVVPLGEGVAISRKLGD